MAIFCGSCFHDYGRSVALTVLISKNDPPKRHLFCSFHDEERHVGDAHERITKVGEKENVTKIPHVVDSSGKGI